MRAVLIAVCVFAVGCGSKLSGTIAEVQAFDVLTAYAKNPAAADKQYKDKRLKVLVSEVAIRRRGEIRDNGDTPANDETVAVFSPARGDMTPSRYALFYFVSENEVAKLKPGTQYAITGDCEGLSGNTVVFRDCTARPLK